MKARITGTGSYLPEKIVSNDELAKWVDTSDEWISSRTGIKKRRIAVGETVEEMATEAAKRALENSGTAPEQIQMIIVATCSKEQCFPSIACQVQKAVGAVRRRLLVRRGLFRIFICFKYGTCLYQGGYL